MPRTFSEAPTSTIERVRETMARYHGGLRDAGVRITILHASGPRDEDGEITAHAIMIRGHKAMACIKITSLKDRAAGLGDAVLTIDGDDCDTWSEEAWSAILDRELTQIELKTDAEGGVMRDDLGRPKLRKRNADYTVDVFMDVAERHKEHTPEVQAVQSIGSLMVRQGIFQGF